MIKGLACILLLWWTCSFEICRATIIVDSVHVTTSTCPNNGTATIYAHTTSDSAVFLYNVVAGPVLYPQQNDSVFASLYPGTYTAWVHDINSYDSTKVTFTITGNYKEPIITAVGVAPFCAGGDDGKIIGTLTSGTGLSPFTWQITSPFMGLPQNNDTLGDLISGSYVVEMTDGCNITRSEEVTIDLGGTGLAISTNYPPWLSFIDCSTLALKQYIYLKEDRGYLPLKLSISTNSGTTVKYVQPVLIDSISIPAQFFITDTLWNISFGDPIKICISDTCNVTVCNSFDSLSLFNFGLIFNPAYSNCISGYKGLLYFSSSNNDESYLLFDSTILNVTLVNSFTNAIVDSFEAIEPFSLNGPGGIIGTIPMQPDTSSYILTVSDKCGNIWQKTIQWKPANGLQFSYGTSAYSCLDSTAEFIFSEHGFGSAPTIEILSGPAISGSTKRGYAYRDTLIYPMSFSFSESSGTIGNLPPGYYGFEAYDSCGNVFKDSFTITDVISMGWRFKSNKNCNSSTIFDIIPDSTMPQSGFGFLFTDTSTVPNAVSNEDSGYIITSALSPGKYVFVCEYGSSYIDFLIPGNNTCWVSTDTLIVKAYNDSILKATDVATCNGTIYIHLEADSSNGILPFQYEILEGPEIFALQESSNFTIHTYGTYLVGVRDACGNEDTRQITVDTGKFNPVVKTGGWCVESKVQLSDVSSPYFTYRWNKPDGSVFTGDTLNIYPFTPNDTGVYYITKIVQINDCSDSAFGTYHLIFRDTFQQNFALCPGDTFHVGPYYHTEPGVYYDTLTGMDGCDSIEVTNFSFLASVQASIFPSSPVTCPIYPTMFIASGGTVYSWSPGGYQTDTVTLNPNIPTTYAVTVGAGGLCPDTASVLVYPVVDSLINISAAKTTFCYLDSALICGPNGFETYIWNDGETDRCIEAKQSGNYYLAVTDYKGCQINSNHLAITVNPAPPVEITISGDTLRVFNVLSCQWYLNGSALANATDSICIAHQPGTYTVFITDSLGCSIMSNGQVITGLNQLQDNISLHIYPDPASDELNIAYALQQAAGVQITVTDLSGRLIQEVLNEKAAGGTYLKQVNIRHMAAGVYVLSFVSDGATALQRFVKE